MKVLLDTNVLIAAFIAEGICSDLLEHCLRRHSLTISEFILNEFRHQLLHKFAYDAAEVDEAVALLRPRAVLVSPVDIKRTVCRDPEDDAILAAAVAGGVACIVTGDKDLLVLRRFGEIDILSPSEFSAYEAAR